MTLEERKARIFRAALGFGVNTAVVCGNLVVMFMSKTVPFFSLFGMAIALVFGALILVILSSDLDEIK